jgi:hypothetical protein
MVEGSVALPPDAYLWVLVRRKDFDGWWPQGGGPVPVDGAQWKVSVKYGEVRDAGCDFEIAALAVRQSTHEILTGWVTRAKETGLFPPVPLPPAGSALGEVYRTVTRAK